MPEKATGRRKPLILVVDDYSDALELYRVFLELEGYDVHVAHDGQQAVSIANEIDPDLVVMDLSMPVLDGLGATRALRQADATRHIPVVALSGHTLPAQREEARSAGCDTVLNKPCLPTDLADKIRSLLHASKPKA